MDKKNSDQPIQYDPILIRSILFGSNFESIVLSDGTTNLLDLLLVMDYFDEFRKFLATVTDVNATVPLDSPLWSGYTVLHLAVIKTESTKLWAELFKKLNLEEYLQFLVQVDYKLIEVDEMIYCKRIEICLEKGYNVNIKSLEGFTPIHLAFNSHNAEITDLLLSKCDQEFIDCGDPSFFHIACATGNLEVVNRFLNFGVNVNSQTRKSFEWFSRCSFHTKLEPKIITVPVNSTALHIAATFQHEEVVKLLLDNQADVYAQNELGLTPIHLSMIPCPKSVHKSPKSVARLLLQRAPNLTESLSSCGFSHLHIAAYADDDDSIKKLLKIGSNIESTFKVTVPELEYLSHYANRTPLHIALFMWSTKAAATLIINGADIFQQTPEQGTPLQILLRFDDDYRDSNTHRYIKNKLKRDKRFNEAIDANGTTLLHVACYLYDFEWAKELLENGADVNARLLKDDAKVGSWKGYTSLHMLIDSVCEKVDEDPDEIVDFVELLMKYGVDVLAINDTGDSALLLARTLACEELYYENYYQLSQRYSGFIFSIVDVLLKNQSTYKINPVNSLGFSHFHYACMRNNVDVVRKFLDNGIDINHTANIMYGEEQDALNFTPLHFSVYHHCNDVACLLIERGANVNAKNGEGETPFHIAVKVSFIDFDLFEMLLSHGADINARTFYDSTPIRYFLHNNSGITCAQLKFFVDNGSKIDLSKEDHEFLIGGALRNTKPSERQLMVQELIDFCQIQEAMKDGFDPIDEIVSIGHDGELTVEFYLYAIQKFMDMGCDIDKNNVLGMEVLGSAAMEYNVEALEALLLLGAKLNVINANIKTQIEKGKTQVATMLAAHIWKMKFVGLKINELLNASMLEIHEKFPLDEDLQRRCEIELAKLAEEKIGESLTIRCLLHEWGPTMDYPTMSFVQRLNIDKFFAKPDDLRKQFPQFCGLLMMQNRKIIARVDTYAIAMRLLPIVIYVDLPALCLDNILKYFDNDELNYFIDGYKDIISK